MNISEICREIKSDEGLRLYRYKDMLNNWTIGYGHLIPTGYPEVITLDQAEDYLLQDIHTAIHYLAEIFPLLYNYPESIQHVLVNMMFNLGPSRFKGFKLFIEAIKSQHYAKAALEMLDSLWASQVPYRVIKLTKKVLMETYFNRNAK